MKRYRLKIKLTILFYLIIGVLTIIFFQGTGGSGDSMHHFLYAKEAPSHPELFFDHWAKPLFVLIASPFAQLGFVGMKIMNLLLVTATIWFTYKTALEFKIRESWLTGLLIIFSPLYYSLTFSGLTEPLFAFILILATYLYLKDKLWWSMILISFLPFVRSEGLFFIGTFGFILLWNKQWRKLPLLLIGSVIYGIAGYPVHGDLLWVFNKVPYAKLSSTYGEGTAFHFVQQLLYVIGIPFYIFFWLGVLAWFRNTWKKGFNPSLTFLIYGGVFAFIIAHSIFWYFGIFNSMGLKRVLISVIPYISIIALIGINFVTLDLLQSVKKGGMILRYLMIAYLVVFPFTSNPAAIDLKHDLDYTMAEKAAQKAANNLSNEPSDFRIVTADIYFCELLGRDCFDESEKVFLNSYHLSHLQENDIVIWENWFAIVEQAISLEQLENHPELQKTYEIKELNHKGRLVHYVVFKAK